METVRRATVGKFGEFNETENNRLFSRENSDIGDDDSLSSERVERGAEGFKRHESDWKYHATVFDLFERNFRRVRREVSR